MVANVSKVWFDLAVISLLFFDDEIHSGRLKQVVVEPTNFAPAFWNALPDFIVNIRGAHVGYDVKKNFLEVSVKFTQGGNLIDEQCKCLNHFEFHVNYIFIHLV